MKTYIIKSHMEINAKTKVEAKKMAKAILEDSLHIKEAPKNVCNPQAIYRLTKELHRAKKETLMIICLDTRGMLIKKEIVSVGILNASLVHPREVFALAIKNSSASIILVHNHPSGDTEFSGEDEAVTNRLVEAGKIMGIEVYDHIIVGKDDYYSFRADNKI